MKRVLRKGGAVRYHRLVFTFALLFIVDLWAPQNVHAEGPTIYWSNLAQASAGSKAVGSDYWVATRFISGSNPYGYILNSIQLGMTAASGTPANLSVALYDELVFLAPTPFSNLGTFSGATDPTSGGVYTYTAPPNLTLSPGKYYYIVLSAEEPIATGAYNWSFAGTSAHDSTGSWQAYGFWYSLNGGTTWGINTPTYLQFSLTATPIPEPGTLGLVMVGAAFVGARRLRRFATVR